MTANDARRKAYAALDRWLQVTLAGIDSTRAKGNLLDTLQEIACDAEVDRIEHERRTA